MADVIEATINVTFQHPLHRPATAVSAASAPTVASRADADRLLRAEPQVRLAILLLISNLYSNHFIARV